MGRIHSGEHERNWTPRWLRKVPLCPAVGEHHPPSQLTQLMGLPQTCSRLPQTAPLLSYISSPECAAHHDPPQASSSQSTTPPPSSFTLMVAEPAQENPRRGERGKKHSCLPYHHPPPPGLDKRRMTEVGDGLMPRWNCSSS